jgi:RNA polymerase sigma-70 factor (ECF subfamily)
LRITKNPRDAEDIGQNVFLALLNKIGTFRGRSSFSSWLYKVAINECYMYLRRTKKYKNWVHFKESSELLIEKNFVFSQDTPDDSVFLREACEKMECILSHMNEGQRTVFLLVDREELNVREVAKILGISVSCVKSRLLRARYFLRNTMSKELGINYRFKPNGQD